MATKEVEKKETTEENEEKKPNAFSKFWNKTKQAVNDSMLESKIENEFRKANDEFVIYEYEKLLGKSTAGYFDHNDGEDAVVLFGKLEVPSDSVIIHKEKDTAYYALSSEEIEVEIEVEGTKYKRPATRIHLNPNVVEVKVIKANNKYYIYNGK